MLLTQFLRVGFAFAFFGSLSSANEPLLPKSCGISRDRGLTRIQPLDSQESEVWFCLGALHAQSRNRQLSHLRKVVQGEQAGVYGKSLARVDYLMRWMRLAPQAEALARALDSETRGRFDAYARGVNTVGLSEGGAWKVSDSVSILLLQALDQTRRTFEGRLRTFTKEGISQTAPTLAWGDAPWDTSVIKSDEVSLRRSESASLPSMEEGAAGDFDEDGFGSNNWVISKARNGGSTWLANDPHLALKTPSFWTLVSLELRASKRVGAALTGAPVLALGTNGDIAWGLTNSYLDVSRVMLVPEAAVGGVESLRPVVWIKLFSWLKFPSFFERLRWTAKGDPILPVPTPEGQVAVLRWSAKDLTAPELQGLSKLDRARSAAEVDQILSGVGLPSWNFVFADQKGAIGYRAVGRIPARKTALPAFAETLSRLPEKEPVLTPEQMPHLLNPKRGYIATANQPQWPTETKFSAGFMQSESFRAYRIEELIRSERASGADTQKRIQCDRQAVDARFFLPKLLPHLERDAETNEASAPLRSWSGFDANPECKPCVLYRLWIEKLKETHPIHKRLSDRALYTALLKDPERSWIQAAFAQALKDSQGRAWSEATFASFSALIPGEAGVETAATGDEGSVNVGSFRWNDSKLKLEQTSGASIRFLVELTGSQTKLWFSYPEPEQPESLKAWSECRYQAFQF